MIRAALNKPKPPHLCFGCTHGRNDSAHIAYEDFRQMEALFNGKLLITDLIEHARICAKFYKEVIQDPTLDPKYLAIEGNTSLPDWDAATILEHFTHHIMDFSIRRHARLRMYGNCIKYQYENCLWYSEVTEDGEEIDVMDPEAWKMLNNMVISEARLFGQNPRTAMFSTTGIGAPREETQALVNLSGKGMKVRNAGRFAGSSVSAKTSGAGQGGTVGAQGLAP